MDPLIGRELESRYRLVARLGEGAMGRVYRADRMDGTGQVAVKVLNEDCTADADLRERFEREARALFGLGHPNILDVQDYGVLDGAQPFLVMELLSGETLESLVESEPLEPALALELGRQLLSGLAFAHSQGVLHRDLKSENVFVLTLPDGSLRAKLLDFGLVKFVDDDRWGEARKLTVAGSVMGSPAYMSPEQGTGGPMDTRSDVYSAGVVLYELLTGTWPFLAESRVEMLKSHLLSPVPPISAGREGLVVRPELDGLIERAMAKEADDRFPDATAMLAALEAIPSPAAWLAEHARASSSAAWAAPNPALDLSPASSPAQPPAGALPPPGTLPPPAPVYAPPVEPRTRGPLAKPLVLLVAGGVLGLCLLSALAIVLVFFLAR